MQSTGKPTLFHEIHCWPPHEGLQTLWFYKSFDPEGPEPSEDPNAIKLAGPTSPGECGTVAKSIKLVLWQLGYEIADEYGADD